MDLTPSQIAKLERLLAAGFRFVTLERFGNYFGIERGGFVALLDPAGGNLRRFSEAGYLMGEGLGMLVKCGAGQAFVWHDQAVTATAELLAGYNRFRADLDALLSEEQRRRPPDVGSQGDAS